MVNDFKQQQQKMTIINCYFCSLPFFIDKYDFFGYINVNKLINIFDDSYNIGQNESIFSS